MAKGNLLLGMGRGKLGDVVLYRQNGQQMSRPRVRVVNNPRTSGQQIQRMVQATIAYAYAGLKTIVDHSFEGVQYGGKSMNYFMKRNMDELRAQVIAGGNGENISARFAIPNVRVLYPNNYVVSNGSLPPCPDPENAVLSDSGNEGIAFGSGQVTEGSLWEFMHVFGADAGDQLTFLIFNTKRDGSLSVASIGDESAYAMAVAIRRIKFKETYTNEQLDTVLNSTTAVQLLDSEVTSTDLMITTVGPNDGKRFFVGAPSFGVDNETFICGGCVIRSKKSGNSWLRSPQSAVIFDNYLTPADAGFKKPGFTLSTAYNAWMSGTTPVGVSEYILNGKPNTDTWPEVDEP